MDKTLEKLQGINYTKLIKKWEDYGFLGDLTSKNTTVKNPLNVSLAYEMAQHYLLDKSTEVKDNLSTTMFPILFKVISRFGYCLEDVDILFIIKYIHNEWDEKSYMDCTYLSVADLDGEAFYVEKFSNHIIDIFDIWDYLGHGGNEEDVDWNQTLVTKFNIAVDSIEKEADITTPIIFKDLIESLEYHKDGVVANRFTINYDDTSKSKMMKIGDNYLIIQQYNTYVIKRIYK